eukprot:3070090-Prymnesium_polylepis.1
MAKVTEAQGSNCSIAVLDDPCRSQRLFEAVRHPWWARGPREERHAASRARDVPEIGPRQGGVPLPPSLRVATPCFDWGDLKSLSVRGPGGA